MSKSTSTHHETESVARTSADLVSERVALRAALGQSALAGPERFSFGWAGKSDTLALLQAPSRATLVPCPEESVNFDTTGNLFVEGDNLEVLTLLYDLARIIDAWPDLPEPIRRAMLALIDE